MRNRPSLPDSDMYAVARRERHGCTVFVVRHFPTREATPACCTVTVKLADGESDLEALRRANQLVERKHAEAEALA